MKKSISLIVMLLMALFFCSCGNNVGQSGESKDKTETEAETQTETEVEEEKCFSYQLLETNKYMGFNYGSGDFVGDWIEPYNSFNGLVICLGDKELSQYLMFDDEEDYYNDYIHEWTLALKMAKVLYNANTRHRLYIKKDNVLYQMNENGDTLVTFRHLYSGNTFNSRNDYAIDYKGDTILHGDTIKEYDYKYFVNNKKSIGELLNYIHCMPNCIDSYNNPEIVELFKKTYYDFQGTSIFEPEKGYGFRRYPIDEGKYGYDYVKLYRIKEGEYNNVPGGVLGIKFEHR